MGATTGGATVSGWVMAGFVPTIGSQGTTEFKKWHSLEIRAVSVNLRDDCVAITSLTYFPTYARLNPMADSQLLTRHKRNDFSTRSTAFE